MQKPFPFGITQQFILFFLCTSVLPIVVIALLFYSSVDGKFNERINSLLEMGVLFSDVVVQRNLRSLEFKTTQGASYGIRDALESNLKRGQSLVSNAEILDFKEKAGLRIFQIHDSQGNILFSSGRQYTMPISKVLVEKALKGQLNSSLGRYAEQSGQDVDLVYLAAAPVYDKASPNRISGVFLAGYPISQYFAFREILKIIPVMHVRIFSQNAGGHIRFLSSSAPGAPEIMPEVLRSQRSRHPYFAKKEISGIVREQAGAVVFRSLAMPLKNTVDETLGYLVVSCSESDMALLKGRNLLFIAIYLLFGLLATTLTALYFKRTVINPMDELALVSEKVAAGHLEVRMRMEGKHHEPPLRNMMDRFNRMLDQLQEHDLLKSTFISTLTHDLRTPLFAQKRVLHTLRRSKGRQDAELNDVLEGLEKNNDHLLEMVTRMLETYQYESGKIELLLEGLDLATLAKECFEEVAPLAEPKRIRLINSVAAGSVILWADHIQLKRVFLNLISNAVENIQEDREVRVDASVKEGQVEIRVADNGPGMNPEILPHIFQRYYAGHPTRQKIGSGLGLFICRMIVELHGGSIAADSEPGQGTTYTIRLPLRLPDSLEGVDL